MASWLKRRNAGTPTHSPGTARCAVELRAEGNAWLDKGDLPKAEACYRQAVAVDATDPLARINLAFVLNEQKRPAEARLHALQATVLAADSVDAFFVLANAQVEEADWPAATASLRRILQLKPDFEPAYGMLCRVLAEQGLLDDARAAIVQALTLNDRSAEFHFLLGNVEMGAGNREEAAASYRRAIALQPGIARFHSNLGMALQGHEALACYHEALRLDPGFAGAHGNFGIALYEQGDISAAVSSIRRAIALETDRIGFRSNLLFVSSLDEDCEPVQYRAEAEAYGELAARLATPFSDWPVARARSDDMPLRVGLVSGDLRSHPVGHFLEAVIAHLTTRHIELVAYPTVAQGDDLTARIRAHFAQWHSLVGLADALAAEMIRNDGIQVLIDLAGHSGNNRLPVFAWRPAPVQATWLGYLATTGVTAIDYVIADAWTLPEALEPQFTERVWRLPDTYLCFTPPAHDVAVGPLPARDTGYVTFGSFNNLSKMNDAVVALWARVLAAVPHSRLFLKAQQLKDPAARQRVVARFARHGIAAERLLLEGPVPRAQYLLPFQRVDIALDPFPYPGITTSVENLWMGVPVLTLAGTTFLSRQGVGLLMNAGLPEWIAHDADDYLARAVSHASDLHTLAALRTRLRQQVLASPIFDAPRFARHFSTALRTMWQHWHGHRDHASR